MNGRIEKRIELKAPVARVWQALTGYREFGEWFRVKLEGPFVPGQISRGMITWPGYEHVKWEAVVQRMVPERLFSFTWHPYSCLLYTSYYGRINRFRYVVLVAFVMVTSLMVSYTRARAEALIGQCKVGFMERPERIVLILLGALFNHWGVMAPVLWVLATLSTITVAHRIIYTYQNTKHMAPLS